MSVVDEVKDRLDIVEVVQTYVPLKKAGRNYKGLCPFHAEKTPSFVVFPHTGTWHCFGACGTGGDVFSFMMKHDNLSFGEALEVLARRAGVELRPKSQEDTEKEQRLALLRNINQAAANYFHHLFVNADAAGSARAYLSRRGLQLETLARFAVGYSLDQWDGLLRYLTGKGYALADIAEAGLIIEREDQGGYYDRFRGRVVFPIRDFKGRTVGFGGRVLDDAVPKYLNSPQTPLFDKSSVLFGLDMARQGIRLTEEAVIVEGYMDVLMAHQFGINNVVAQMGTALTEAQLRRLKRYTQRIILALDSDTAGDQATLRGLDVARQVMDHETVPVLTARGMLRFEDRLAADIRIATLPDGLDPDEVIRENPSRWAQLIAQAKPLMDYYFEALTADLDLGTARGKAEAFRALGPLVAEIGDRVQRMHYLQRLARMVQVDERTLWQQLRQQTGSRPTSQHRQREASTTVPQKTKLDLDEHCLALLLSHPELLPRADAALREGEEAPLDPEDFAHVEDRVVFAAWRHWLERDGTPNVHADFYDSLEESLQERISLLLGLHEGLPPVSSDKLRFESEEAAIRLRLRNLNRQIHELRFLLEDAAEPDAHGPMIGQLTARILRLQRATDKRSLSGRRQREDAAVRVPFGEE